MTEKTQTTANEPLMQVAHAQVAHDLKNSILIISVILNLVVLTTWILLQITSQYDTQLASAIFSR